MAEPELRRRDGAVHDELVPSSLDAVYGTDQLARSKAILARGGECGPDVISGPFDWWSLQHLRERIGLPSLDGDVRPTDVFLWSVAPAPHPAATCFGGLPYLPRCR